MKYFLSIALILIVANSFGQSKKEIEVMIRTKLLSETVFGTKDSLTLEDLFAQTLTYGHSGGKLESRVDAIRNIVHNKSVYSDIQPLSPYEVWLNDDVAIVRHKFTATETKEDGKTTPLNLSIMLVWVKEKGKWKLFGRQAVKLQ